MKTKSILIHFIVLYALWGTLQAQDSLVAQKKDTSYWKKKAQIGVSFSQASFSDNWKGGGVSSIALGGFINAEAHYLKNKTSWDNTVRLEYGILKNKDQNLRKTTDRILFDSKLGYKLSKKWNAYVSINFLSQFDAGFEYDKTYKDSNGNVISVKDNLISKFFAPAYLTEAIGFEYKPTSYFWARFGIASIRQTFVMEESFNNNKAVDLNGNGIINEPTDGFDKTLNYGAEEGQNFRNEVGLITLETDFNKEVAKNLILQAHYWSFSTYENPAATDIRIELALIAKINSFANAKISGTFLYDEDQDFKPQYAQALTLNFAINR
ncbi:MAG: DUF3078 domain-containing protein [Thermonemataceae bacterium]|nr:DUF3078 domain-containing protein [Thermonemataceae bacterium]